MGMCFKAAAHATKSVGVGVTRATRGFSFRRPSPASLHEAGNLLLLLTRRGYSHYSPPPACSTAQFTTGRNTQKPVNFMVFAIPRRFALPNRRTIKMAKKSGGKKKKKVESVFLVCDESGEYNYTLRRKLGGEKLRLKKYCPRLQRHTMHTEKKK